MKTEHIALETAYAKGYRVQSDGTVISPTGRIRKLSWYDGTYYRFSVGYGDNKKFGVSVHRLAAYQKYGKKLFEPGMVTRHLDGNAKNNALDNIVIGSLSENSMDRNPEDRSAHASIAGRARSHLSTNDVLDIREMFSNGATLMDVMLKYHISKSTASYIKNRKTYKNL